MAGQSNWLPILIKIILVIVGTWFVLVIVNDHGKYDASWRVEMAYHDTNHLGIAQKCGSKDSWALKINQAVKSDIWNC